MTDNSLTYRLILKEGENMSANFGRVLIETALSASNPYMN